MNDDRGAVAVEERERPVGDRHAGGHRLQRAAPVLPDFQVRDVSHVEWMVRVRIGIARRSRVEVAACGREVRLALADRMQVNTVKTGLETCCRHRDVDDASRALSALDKVRTAGDTLAFDVGVRTHGARCPRTGSRRLLRVRDTRRERHRRARQDQSLFHTAS